MKLTAKQKIELYDKGLYLFPPPPVCTVLWNRASWINFIDSAGKWLIRKAD